MWAFFIWGAHAAAQTLNGIFAAGGELSSGRPAQAAYRLGEGLLEATGIPLVGRTLSQLGGTVADAQTAAATGQDFAGLQCERLGRMLEAATAANCKAAATTLERMAAVAGHRTVMAPAGRTVPANPAATP